MNNNLLPDYEIEQWLELVAEKLNLSDEVTDYIDEVLSKCNNIWLPWDLEVKYTMIESQLKARELTKEELIWSLTTLLDLLIANKMLNPRDIMNIILTLTNRVINENIRLSKLKEEKKKKKKK